MPHLEGQHLTILILPKIYIRCSPCGCHLTRLLEEAQLNCLLVLRVLYVDTEDQAGGSGRAQRKRQRPQYLASYDEGQARTYILPNREITSHHSRVAILGLHTHSVSALQIFDASQHDDSQHDAAEIPEPQIPSSAAPVTRPVSFMPALAPEVASNIEQEIPPPSQRCKSAELAMFTE